MSKVYLNNVPINMLGDAAGRPETMIAKAKMDAFAAVLTINSGGLSDITPYVLVDLDDDTNFPHTDTGKIWLKKVIVSGAKLSDTGEWNLKFGVVSNNDGTNGTVDFFGSARIFRTSDANNDTEVNEPILDFCGEADPRGLCLEVSGGAPVYFVTNDQQAANTNWQNDVARTSPVGTSNPGIGDLVMLADEIVTDAALTVTITVIYSTEA